MSDGKAYEFGDVVRVDPVLKTSAILKADFRRWMVIAFDDRNKWTMLFLGSTGWAGTEGEISHWDTLHGFVRVENET